MKSSSIKNYPYFLILFLVKLGLLIKGDDMSFTAVIQKVKEGYIGFVEELPGANTQGETIEEVRENLKEAVQLILETNKTFLGEIVDNENVIREPLNLAS